MKIKLLLVYCGVLVMFVFISCTNSLKKADKKVVLVLQPEEQFPLTHFMELLQQRISRLELEANLEVIDEKTLKLKCAISGDPNLFKEKLTANKTIGFSEIISPSYSYSFWNQIIDSIHDNAYQFAPNGLDGAVFLTSKLSDTAYINTILKEPASVMGLETLIDSNSKFLWGLEDKVTNSIPLYMVKLNKDGALGLEGDIIKQASFGEHFSGNALVNVTFKEKASLSWEQMTGEAYREGTFIAVVVNDRVLSAPGVSSGPIVGGKTQILGDFSEEQAEALVAQLNLGYLPPVNVMSYQVEPLP